MGSSGIAAVVRAAIAVLCLTGLLVPRRAGACASCDCGDPTLTASGLEKPYKNRVRLGLDERFGGHTVQMTDGQLSTWTLRSTFVATWSPMDRLTLAMSLPLVSEWILAPVAPRQNVTGLGDAELAARGVVWRNRSYSPRHLVSLLGGLKFPTGPRVYDDSGYPYSEDDQPGSGSFDPFAGATWGWFGEKVSTFVSASYRLTTDGRRGYRRGMSVGGSGRVQFQPMPRVALGLSADVRWADADSEPTADARGASMRADVADTGGTLLALTPSITVAPVPRWLITLGMQVRVGEWLNGTQSDSHVAMLSSVVDLN